MEIHFTGDNFVITDALRDYTKKRFEHLDNRGDHIISVNVIMSVQKLRQIAKANVHVPGKDFHAEAETEDMYASIDELTKKLKHQIVNHKEQVKNHHPHTTDRVDVTDTE
jgi:putative sigma-54 modulation protein